ncbi:inward rectifier potassium channel [Nonlabens dokdonensis]|uniref:K+ channel, inward rectifier n=2 Tax=Nonlabens dokdonensis TaxID=328515 RepID=M0QSD5_NONDD|nr:ion channel [Nonlabens dokdonensis]AGC77518.1 K+ channel, inward rectifier [Nonlabens dokdonensis DSW-6]PZX39927.1 inward rectifier potassium channel [Nonlabens dokdonensis]
MKEKEKKYNDFGLGEKPETDGYRAVNKDGSFNIVKTNIPFFEKLNFFHNLVTMSWSHFFLYILIGYFVINILFASIYVAIGVENLTGTSGNTLLQEFTEAFFFSAQTITTLGYGRVAPIGIPANIVAAIESMLGLLTFALATGLLYGRFSKSRTKIKYSDIGVIAPYLDINGFMIRVVNPQKNELLEVNADLSVSFCKKDSQLREFHNLELERDMVFFFPSVWTIVHPIDESSPLYQMTQKEFQERDVEFIVMLKAFDESSSQTLYSRSSYKANEIVWGAKFTYLGEHDDGKLNIDVSGLNKYEKYKLQ